MDIKRELDLLPKCSGVYKMYDEYDQILYVGKAKNLHARVRQYFQNGKNLTEKTLILVSKITSIKYIITKNEIDALVLENNLIKEYKPYYNILLKDDKSYPYIKINMKESFPKIEVVRRLRADGSRYFGPYMLGITTKDILHLIQHAFPLRNCNLDISKKNNRTPCLNFHIKNCLAPCAGLINVEQYQSMIRQIIDFLNGNDVEVKTKITQKMMDASKLEEFELARDYRDSLQILAKIVRQQISALPKDFSLDIFTYAVNEVFGVINVMVVRGGKLVGAENYNIPSVGNYDDIMSSFLMQYYDKNPVLCDEVVLMDDITFSTEVADFLTSKKKSKINILAPKGGVRKQLAEMSYNNASEYLHKSVTKMQSKESLTIGSVQSLQENLRLLKPPKRIECYDISNISGSDKVASMVVFINGEPAKDMYRKFKIKTVKGIDDFASMAEVISRRISDMDKDELSFSKIPDLIVVDGGKGQLSSAYEIVKGKNINLIGLAKREEEIFLPELSEPIILSKDCLGLKLLQRIRDEAHRFAITFHRNLRSKRQTASNLKNIDGIGDNMARKLLCHFKKIDNIAKATLEDIMQVDGLGKIKAQNVFEYFKTKQ